MPEFEQTRSPGRKRPRLPEIEKLRRAAVRFGIKLDEMRRELDELGDNQRDIDENHGLGRKPISRKVAYENALAVYDKMCLDIITYEEQNNIKHVPLGEIKDPLVENDTLKKVGRPRKDLFSKLDMELKKATRTLASTLDEWSNASSEYPVSKRQTEKSGVRYGRKPKSYAEKVAGLKLSIAENKAKLSTLEASLSHTEVLERRTKLLRDARREAVKEQKKAVSEFGPESEQYSQHEAVIAGLDSEIKNILVEIVRSKESVECTAKLGERVMLKSPADNMLEELIQRADVMLSKSTIAPQVTDISSVDQKQTAEDLKRTKSELKLTEQYFELLKRKQALLEEVAQIDAQLNTLRVNLT